MPELFPVAGSLSNAWADLDGDGDSDLAVLIKSGEVRLYLNDKGTFINVGEAFGLPLSGDEIRSLSRVIMITMETLICKLDQMVATFNALRESTSKT